MTVPRRWGPFAPVPTNQGLLALTATKGYDQGLGVGPSPSPLGQHLEVQQLACSPPASSGSCESGKLTIVKQMKIIHQNGYTREELLAFRPLIWKNLLESARDVVLALAKFNLEPITPVNKVHRLFPLFCPLVLPHSICHRLIASVS